MSHKLGNIQGSEGRPLLAVGETPARFTGGNAGFWACVFNLANAAMGAGVLAFPFAYEKAGYVLGTVMAVVGGLLFCFTLNIVGTASDEAFRRAQSGEAVVTQGSYQEVTAAILGKKAGKIMQWLLVIYLTSSNIAFLVIMSDQAQPVMIDKLGPKSHFAKKEVLVPIFAWVIGFPLSMIKNIELFSIPSTLSQFGIFYSVGIVAYFGYSNISGNQQSPGYGTLSAANWDLEAITAIPLICFSYQCHVTFPLVYASMKGKSMSKMRIVNIVCIVGCMLIYLLIGSGGYVLLGQATPDDILKGVCGDGAYFNKTGANNAGCCVVDPNHTNHTNHTHHRNGTPPSFLNDYYGDETVHSSYYHDGVASSDVTTCSSHVLSVVVIARFCVLIKVACSFGMIVYVARGCIESIAMGEGGKFTQTKSTVVNMIYVAFCMVVAMFCPGLSTALSFAGVLVVVIDLIFPGLMLLKMNKTSTKSKITAYFLIVIGTIIGAISLFVIVQTIYQQAHKDPGHGNSTAIVTGESFGPGF